MTDKSNKRPISDNWRIFIMAHNGVHDRMYVGDPDFSRANYTVINLAQTPFAVSERYDLVNQFDLPSSVALGRWWAESEGIYNIYRNGLHRSLDFVGFLHYDVALEYRSRILRRPHRDITRRIDTYLRGKKKAHISLETHHPATDYAQRIMADITQPNTLQGKGLNCYDYIIRDFNEFFAENRTVRQFLSLRRVNLCSCFLVDVPGFDRMMTFFDWVVRSKRLEVFDTAHAHRLQGGLAERYFGVFLAFNYDHCLDLRLTHHWDKGLK
jgi:hypothetical protein